MLVRLSQMNKKFPNLWLLILLSLALVLAACGPQSAPVPATETPAELAVTEEIPVPPTPSPVSTEAVDLSAVSLPAGIELEFWHPWSGDLANWIAEAVEQFNRENQWGITVNIQAHADELVLLQDINQAAVNGEYPDVIAAPSAYLKTWYRQGWPLLDLAPFTDSTEYGLDPNQLATF
ncbi:MAG: hypothetical protein H5T99_08855, partial [Moorella sp. (in: Bacteria)]|nr:hypothetical protein [Moorella sp. (in: firmicutes)]